MSMLPILQYPDDRLRQVALAVDVVDDTIRQLADDMLETMYADHGVGLAAIQVNVKKRVIVLDISELHNQPMVLINPEIVQHDGEQNNQEGCLSVPGYYANVPRYASITASYLNQQGEAKTIAAEGLLSVCIQHEIDHLNGKLFVDYLSKLKRNRLQKKMAKLQKMKM